MEDTPATRPFPDLMAYAMLGAMEAGRGAAAQDVRVGSHFRGAMPAADAAGLHEPSDPDDAAYRSLRSMFIFGYLEVLKTGHLYTDIDTGKVVAFRSVRTVEG